jgi:4-amino-4-deoxy-L-arabinose transferase-like glycosyltransferase
MSKLIIILIVLIGFSIRIHGLNWDQDQHLHPDERFLTMVGQAIRFPTGFRLYFDTQTSQLNPNNIGFPFYVYGTLPLFLVKLISLIFNFDTYNGITLVGRLLSALADTGIIILVYLLSLKIFKSKTVGFFASFIYASSVLSIQLSHFFAVDTFLAFFLVFTFYLFIIRKYTSSGLVYGLAAASKISAALFLPIYIIGFIKHRKYKSLLIFGLAAFLTFRLFQPYAFSGLFSVNPKFISAIKELKSFDDKSGWFPPAVQWIRAVPLLFPLENLIFWGLGPLLGIFSLVSVVYSLFHFKKYPGLLLCLLWIFGLFLYQGTQMSMNMRYFYPIYPFLALCSGFMLTELFKKIKFKKLTLLIILIIIIIWPLSFISIYNTDHTRVQASQWIYQHLPPGSTISCEYWDDCLPLGGSGPYNIVELKPYDQDLSSLSRIDYLVLSSNRLYGSIMTVPEKYPVSAKFYYDLFSGKLGFKPVTQFVSRPNLKIPYIRLCIYPPFINYGKIVQTINFCPQPGISFVDDYADESFTVYDHPKVIIFQRI